MHSPTLVQGLGLRIQDVPAHASGVSPHMLACSSTSLAENDSWQIGHWTQGMCGELSGEDTHSTDGDEDRDDEGEAGRGGVVSPQVAACRGRSSMLKEPMWGGDRGQQNHT